MLYWDPEQWVKGPQILDHQEAEWPTDTDNLPSIEDEVVRGLL